MTSTAFNVEEDELDEAVGLEATGWRDAIEVRKLDLCCRYVSVPRGLRRMTRFFFLFLYFLLSISLTETATVSPSISPSIQCKFR